MIPANKAGTNLGTALASKRSLAHYLGFDNFVASCPAGVKLLSIWLFEVHRLAR